MDGDFLLGGAALGTVTLGEITVIAAIAAAVLYIRRHIGFQYG